MNKFDLIIIGAGPGGYEMASEAASKGLNVLIVEKDELGGTCLNRGCIPTKALCAGAANVAAVKNAAEWGISVGEPVVDYSFAAKRKDEVVARLREGVQLLLNRPEITIVNGEAKFVDKTTIEVDEQQYCAENIVVASGSEPKPLPIPGVELTMSSDDLLRLETLPKSLCVIGGGVIGMEFASILNTYGVEVTVVEFCKEILPPFDKDVAKRLRQTLSRQGINIVTQASVNGIYKIENDRLSVTYIQKGKDKIVEVDAVLLSVGRKPVIPTGLKDIGVDITPRGIVVDEDMRTSVAGIYAIGDVNGLCMLAHAATAQGKVTLSHILHRKSTINLNVVPSAVFTVPELAMVGLTEEQCEAKGLDYSIKKSFFRANGKAVAMGEPDGILKLIIENETNKILGCHICGAHAADLIQEVATVMTANLPIDAIDNAIHGHPTLSEVVAAAAHQY